ncbi:MAG: hypothetical protein M3R17_19810, partial [Bacteroidota bacterium]|nr:hypothetical protein [Bacteroidota bacterium]
PLQGFGRLVVFGVTKVSPLRGLVGWSWCYKSFVHADLSLGWLFLVLQIFRPYGTLVGWLFLVVQSFVPAGLVVGLMLSWSNLALS